MIGSDFLKTRFPLICILLLGYALAVWQLADAPPGLTHDEANHGTEAFEVLDGVYRAYFPLGYGREPLYAYLLAGVMSAIRANAFVMRLVVPWFTMLGFSAMYVWVRQAFNRPIAHLTLAAWAVSFWPIVVSHQALRSGILPFFMILFVASGWHLWQNRSQRESLIWSLIGGGALGAMLYTYIAARVLWLVLPGFAIYLVLFHGRRGRQESWRQLIPVLLGWGMAIPLFVYLANNPGLETRLDMLDGPLSALREGNPLPILRNVWRALLGLVWPGRGDQFLAYNIPGRPTLNPVSAVLAVIGLGVTLWKIREPRYALVLGWLIVGLSPSLITGPTANTTRNIGALPVLYLLPVIGLYTVCRWMPYPNRQRQFFGIGFAWLSITLWLSTTTFFGTWQQQPDVRAAYQTTMIAQLETINSIVIPEQAVVVSSVLPGPAHDPSIAQLVFEGEERAIRWVDARRALILPIEAIEQPELLVFAPASADLHPYFAEKVTAENRREMRDNDLDPYFRQVILDKPALPDESLASLGGAIELLSAEWLAEDVPPNGVGEFLTVWRVIDPDLVGPTHLPAEATELNLFLHVLWPDGTILTQEDRLDAPSWDWRAGDVVLQIHQVYIDPSISPGEYKAVVGAYDRPSGARLIDAETGDSFIAVNPLTVTEP